MNEGLTGVEQHEELERVLSEYAKGIQDLCNLYNINPKSDKCPPPKVMRFVAKELSDLQKETEHHSIDVSSVSTIIESGTEIIQKTFKLLENDSDLVQPCRYSSVARDLSDKERQIILPGVIKHVQQIKKLKKILIKQHKASQHKASQHKQSASQELGQLFEKFRIIYNKMGIDKKVCEDCAALEESSVWELKIPSEVTTGENVKYSVSSTAGKYECSETGLRWRCVSDVSLEYQFVDWESFSEDLMNDYKPCGPLMDITVTSGTLKEIHLPHFICVDSISSSDNAVKALHVKGSEVSLERCELTRFHAKLLNPTFSFLGVIAQCCQYLFMKFHCETLIYRTDTPSLKLHVYLILKDPKLKEEVEKTEENNMRIIKPKPDKALKINDCYTLKTSCDSTIKPQSLHLTPCKANFFDVHFKDAQKCIKLYIMSKEEDKIWDVNIESDEFSLNRSVSDSRQSTSSTTVDNRHGFLLECLENLEAKEIKVFKWHLTEGVAGFRKTNKCKLEEKDRCEIVACMIKQHGVDGAAELTMTILKQMQKNYDAEQLQEKLDDKD